MIVMYQKYIFTPQHWRQQTVRAGGLLFGVVIERTGPAARKRHCCSFRLLRFHRICHCGRGIGLSERACEHWPGLWIFISEFQYLLSWSSTTYCVRSKPPLSGMADHDPELAPGSTVTDQSKRSPCQLFQHKSLFLPLILRATSTISSPST